MAESPELRQRKPQAVDDDETPKTTTSKTTTKRTDDQDDDRLTFYLDILRVITFVIVASCGLSYIITGGKSWAWGGVRLPEYMTTEYWDEWMVRTHCLSLCL